MVVVKFLTNPRTFKTHHFEQNISDRFLGQEPNKWSNRENNLSLQKSHHFECHIKSTSQLNLTFVHMSTGNIPLGS